MRLLRFQRRHIVTQTALAFALASPLAAAPALSSAGRLAPAVLPLGAAAGFGAAAVSGCATGDGLAGVALLGGAGGAALVCIGCAVSGMFGQLSENFKSRSKLSDPENSERHGAATVSGGRSEHYTHISWQTQCTALRQVASQTNEVHENRARSRKLGVHRLCLAQQGRWRGSPLCRA